MINQEKTIYCKLCKKFIDKYDTDKVLGHLKALNNDLHTSYDVINPFFVIN